MCSVSHFGSKNSHLERHTPFKVYEVASVVAGGNTHQCTAASVFLSKKFMKPHSLGCVVQLGITSAWNNKLYKKRREKKTDCWRESRVERGSQQVFKHCASRHSHCGLEMAASVFAFQISATAQQSSLVWKYSFSSTPITRSCHSLRLRSHSRQMQWHGSGFHQADVNIEWYVSSNWVTKSSNRKLQSSLPILQSSNWQVSQLTEGACRCQFNPYPPFLFALAFHSKLNMGRCALAAELVRQHYRNMPLLTFPLPLCTLLRWVCDAFFWHNEEFDGCWNEALRL